MIEIRYINLSELTVHFRESGKGRPLIFLHGGGLSSEIWEPHLSILTNQFHVFAPDCRGHGRTKNTLEKLNYQILAGDLAEFIDQLGIEKPFICGWSMGARTALEFAMRFPKTSTAIVCCGGGPILPVATIHQIIEEEEKLLQDPKTVEMMQNLHSSLYGEDNWKTLVTQLHGLLLDSSLEEYDRIVVPTLIMCGDREQRPGIEEYVELFRKIPKSELAVIPNSGHFSPISNVDLFIKITSEFFMRCVMNN